MMMKNNEGEIKNMDIYIFNEKTLDSKKSENKNLNIKNEFIFKNIKMSNNKKPYQKNNK